MEEFQEIKPPKTAVIGATGYVGRHLLRVLRTHHPDCTGTSRVPQPGLPAFDLVAPDIRPLRLAETGHTHVVIAAARTRVDDCEHDPAGSRAVNVDGTLELARQLREEGISTIAFSSDYVFDGSAGGYDDNAVPCPVNEYGRQKFELERELRAAGKDVLILRLSKVFGMTIGDRTLLDEMASSLRSGRVVRAASDQVFSPILVDDLVRCVLIMAAHDTRGLVNAGGPRACSRLELAQAVGRGLAVPQESVQTISLADLGEPFDRPRNTSMRSDRLGEQTGIELADPLRCAEKLAQQYVTVAA